jgi:tRNA U34 5-carboxymethylaminomethyl modifying GTPase MnmE/TrmE
MKTETNDIIVALATAHGSSAIAIIRLSGPEVLNIVEPFIYSKTLNPECIQGFFMCKNKKDKINV